MCICFHPSSLDRLLLSLELLQQFARCRELLFHMTNNCSIPRQKIKNEEKKNTSWEENKTGQGWCGQHREWQLCIPSFSPFQRVSELLDFSLHLAHPLRGLKELNIKWALGAVSSLVRLHTADGAGRSWSRLSGISQFRVQKVKHIRSGRSRSPFSLHFPFARCRSVFGGCSPSLALCNLCTLVQRAAFRKHHSLHRLHAAWKRFPQTWTEVCKRESQINKHQHCQNQDTDSYFLQPETRNEKSLPWSFSKNGNS